MMFAIFVGSIFYASGRPDLMKGIILGTLFSIINFVLMGETLPYRLNKGKSKTIFAALGSMAFRYPLLAVPVVLAIKFEEYNLFAAFAGVFMVQLLILLDHIGGSVVDGFKRRKESQVYR